MTGGGIGGSRELRPRSPGIPELQEERPKGQVKSSVKGKEEGKPVGGGRGRQKTGERQAMSNREERNMQPQPGAWKIWKN